MKTRVVVLSNRSLLASGVGEYLEAEGGMDVAELSFDSPSWRRQLRSLAPRTVLIDGGNRRAARALVGPILTDLPDSDVVMLNFEQSDLHVYSSKRVPVSNLDQIVQVIRERPAPRSARKRAHPSTATASTPAGVPEPAAAPAQAA